MENKHLISIIIPAYNNAQFLGEAIESVKAQTYPYWEIIVVDDGSTDNTPEVATNYYEEIQYVRQSNLGHSVARNTGLSIAKGDYILFLDSDDLLLKHSLEKLSVFLDLNPEYGAVYSDGYYCDRDKNIIQTISKQRPANYSGEILEKLVCYSLISAIHSAMIRAQIIHENEIYFDKHMISGEDWDFFIQLGSHTKIGYVDIPTCLYRIHGGNITSTTESKKSRESYIRNRNKVMNSSYFPSLSIGTQKSFFYSFLIKYLKQSPDQQIGIVNSDQFLSLQTNIQGELLRHAGSEAILNHNKSHAHRLLKRSLTTYWKDWKTIGLFFFFRMPVILTNSSLKIRRNTHNTFSKKILEENDRIYRSFHIHPN